MRLVLGKKNGVMEQPLVLSHLILSTMPLSSYQMNYPTLQFDCVIEQPSVAVAQEAMASALVSSASGPSHVC